MLKTYNQSRASGKTTEVITRMKYDRNIVVLVPHRGMEMFYPKEYHHRIIPADSFFEDNYGRGKDVKFIFDEGFLMQGDKLAEFYYRLGQEGISMEVYGTAR